MKLFLKAGASAAVLLAFSIGVPGMSRAADVADPGCTLHGAVQLGYMFTNSDVSASVGGFDEDADWQTPFGEGAGLVTCDAWNFQADFAYYAHETDIDTGKDSIDIDATEGHFGGALFWRDADRGAFGISASHVEQSLTLIDTDYWRGGVFGEFYFGNSFTIGGSAHYFSGKDLDFADKDHEGFELTANAKFYVMPELSLSLQGDLMLGELNTSGPTIDYDGWAITGEAEYLVWDEGLSVFGGARYAEREMSFSGDSINVDDLQVFAGIEFAFGAAGSSLAGRDRSGPVDNTSVMFEKLPDFFTTIIAASAGGP